ncbi:hypothetical protein, partial [Microbispora rosea]
MPVPSAATVGFPPVGEGEGERVGEGEGEGERVGEGDGEGEGEGERVGEAAGDGVGDGVVVEPVQVTPLRVNEAGVGLDPDQLPLKPMD